MKYALLLLAVCFCVTGAQAQDTSVVVTKSFYADSLKTTHDTIDVYVGGMSASYYTITVYTDAGTDTVLVYTSIPGGNTRVQHSLVDMTDRSTVTQIVATTTAKEYAILDTRPGIIRVYSPGTTSVITRFVIGGK
jgi:hypothetical protein